MYRSRNNQGSRHVQWRGNGFHSQQLIIPKSVGDAQCQIDEVLKRWGFIVNRKTDERNFVRSIKDATADCLTESSSRSGILSIPQCHCQLTLKWPFVYC